MGTTGKQRVELQALLDRETEEKKILNEQSKALNAKLHVRIIINIIIGGVVSSVGVYVYIVCTCVFGSVDMGGLVDTGCFFYDFVIVI